MADLNITGSVRVDASQAEGEFRRLGGAAERMSRDIGESAGRTGRSINSIGAGANQSAAQLTRSQSRIRDEISRTTTQIQQLGKTASQKFEIKIAAQGLDPTQFGPYLRRLREVEAAQASQASGAARAAQGTAVNSAAMTRAAGAANEMGNALRVLAATYGVGQLIQLTDQYTKFTAQLRLAANSTNEYATSLASVRAISTEAQQSIGSVGVLYARVANSTRELGVSQKQVGDIVRSVALSLAVSGSTAVEASSTILQLSQAFASGTLRGEEFNAVNEASPRLMKALAEGMGVPIGALKEMASAGLITSAVLAQALPKALAELTEEAKEVTTISGAFTVFNNELLQFVGTSANSSGAIKAITSSIIALAENLNTLAAVGVGLALAKVTSAIGAIGLASYQSAAGALAAANALGVQRAATIAAAQAEIASTAATTARLGVTQAVIVASRQEAIASLASANATAAQATAQIAAARAAGAQSFALTALAQGEVALLAAQRARSASMAELALLGQQQARVSAQITAATLAQTAAQAGLTAANTAGGASAALATRALGFLGGPIGIVTTLLGLGATAWILWGGSAKKAASEASGAIETSTTEIIATLDKQISKLKERNALARAGLPEIAKGASEASQRLAALQVQIDNLQSGKGPTGGAALPEAARVGVLQSLLREYGTLAEKIQEVDVQQKALDSFGKESKAGEWLGKYATQAEKLTAELALARKELGNAFSPEIERRIRAQYEAKTSGAKGAAAAVAKEATAYEKLMADINGRIEANGLEAASGDAVTESQKLRIKIDRDMAAGSLKLTAANEQSVRAKLDEFAASESLLTLEKDRVKSMADTLKLIEDTQQTDAKTVAAAIEAATTAEEQLRNYGLLKSEVMSLTLAQLQNARESAALAGEDVSNIQKRIEAQKRLIAATVGLDAREAADKTSKDALEATAKAAADATAEWQKTADSINSSLTDALMRGFEDGKGFAKNLRDTLTNMFKTMVLRPTISAVLAPVAGGLSGAANAAGGGGGDIKSMISSLNSSISSSIGKSFGEFARSSSGQSLGLSQSSAMGPLPGGGSLTSSGQLASQGLQVLGDTMAGYALGSMARTMISGGYSAGKGMDSFQKVGIAIGSAIGGPVVGAIIGAGAGVFNRLLGRKLKDSGVEGSFGGQEGFSGNSFEFMKGGFLRSDKTNRNPLDEEVRKGLGDAFGAMRIQVGTFATALGLNTDQIAGFTSTIKLSLKGLSAEDADKKIQEALATANNALAEQVLGTFTSVTEQIAKTVEMRSGFGDSLEIFYATVNETITKTAYTASEFARDSELAIDTLKRLSGSLMVVNGTFDTLGYKLLETSLAGGDLASKLADAFGGLDQLASATSTYYEAFYSEQERTETGVRQLTETLGKLGIALPNTGATDALAQYRALVDAQDIATESGRNAYAALVTLGGGFAQLVTSTQSLAAAAADAVLPIDKMAEALASALGGLGETKFDLENELLTAQGNTEAVRERIYARDLAALTKGLDAESALKVTAAFAGNEALRQQITTLSDATTASEALELAMASFTDRFTSDAQKLAAKSKTVTDAFAAYGATVPDTKAAFMELAAANEGPVLNALLAVSGAFADVAEAATEAATAAALALANINRGIQDQIDLLTGAQTQNTLALRDAADQSTKALLRQLFALQDAAAAQETYTAALASAKSAFDTATSALTAAQNAAQGIQQQGTDQYLNALEKVAQAQQSLTNLQVAAQDRIAQASIEAAEKLNGLGKSLRAFVADEIGGAAPGANFGSTLAAARGGNTDAIAGLAASARGAIDAALTNARSSQEFNAQRASILAAVAEVAARSEAATSSATLSTPADSLAIAQAALIASQADLAESLRVANAINAPLQKSQADLIALFAAAQSELVSAQSNVAQTLAALQAIQGNTLATSGNVKDLNGSLTVKLAIEAASEITKLITVIGNVSSLPAETRALALLQSEAIQRTIGFLAGANPLSETVQALALRETAAITRTIGLIAGADTLSEVQRLLALSSTASIVKSFDIALRSDTLTEQQKILVLSTSSQITKTLNAIAGSRLTGNDLTLALSSTASIVKSFDIALRSDTLTEQQKTLALSSSSQVTKTINALAGSRLTGNDLTLALASTSSITKTIVAALGAGNASALALATAQAATITRTITAAGGTLTADQRAILGAISGGTSLSLSASTITFDPSNSMKSVFDAIAANTMLTALYMTGFMASSFTEAGAFSGSNQITSDGVAIPGTYGLMTQQRDYLMLIYNRLMATLTVTSSVKTGGFAQFATGGVFTNSVVSRPTMFPMGLMGEAGDEAIMPLKRGADGSLGVQASIDLSQFQRNNSNGAEALTAEIRNLREDNRAQARSMVAMQQRMTKILELWNGTGLPEARVTE